MTIKVKPGAVLVGSNAVNIILEEVELCFDNMGSSCTVTAGVDGTHRTNSRHYALAAVDFRTRNLTTQQKGGLVGRVQDALGDDYDIVLHETHLHVEHDPK